MKRQKMAGIISKVLPKNKANVNAYRTEEKQRNQEMQQGYSEKTIPLTKKRLMQPMQK